MNEDFNKYGYTIEGERPADVTAIKIRKSGIVADFTIAEMQSTRLQAEKMVTELTAKQNDAKAKSDNVAEHHPFVKDMSMEDLFACHMYYENVALLDLERGLPSKIKEIQEAIDESIAEEAHIAKVLEIDLTPAEAAPAPEAAPEATTENAPQA